MKKSFKILLSASALLLTEVAAVTAVKALKTKKDFPPPSERFTLTAHTGCENTEDNSLEAITKGIEAGADIVEFDLRFTSEGLPILAHDKPTGGEVTLDEAFRLVSQYENIKVNVDVKTAENLKAVTELAEKHGLLQRIFYTGIEEEKVETVKRDTPDVPYYLNASVDRIRKNNPEYLTSLADLVEEKGAVGINMNYKNCTDKLMEIFRERNLLVSLWTANKKSQMYFCLALSPDNITTRHPSVLKEIINQNN